MPLVTFGRKHISYLGASAFFRSYSRMRPGSSWGSVSHGSDAEALLTAGDYEPALAAQRRALSLEPDNENARWRMTWIEDRIAVRDQPVSVPSSLLERYVGEYGPRHVRHEHGILYYQREGNPEYRLIPMTEDLFALDGLETFRIRFVRERTGPASKIVGLYLDGSVDETTRSR